MKDAIATHYGDKVADAAFREIDYRSKAVSRGFFGRFKSKSVTGHHLMTATARAIELAAPQIGARARREVATHALAAHAEALETAQRDLASANDQLDGLYEEQSDSMSFSLVRSQEIEGLKRDIAALKGAVADIQRGIEQSTADKLRAEDDLASFSVTPLAQSQFGKAQKALAQVAEDNRFFSLLNDQYARGQAVHGGGGSAQRIFSKTTLKTVGKEGFSYALPPVAVGKAFYSAIRAEDRERRFAAIGKHIGANPLSKAMAKTLSAKAEQEKWKKGLGATVGFVAMGLTLHLGPLAMPGIGLATKSAGQAASHSVARSTSHALGKAGSKDLAYTASKATGFGINRTGTGLGKFGAKRALLPGKGRYRSATSIQETIDAQITGNTLPTIPVKMIGSNRIKEFNLGEPKVAQALLHYLGPKVDTHAIARGDANEARRKELRDLIGVSGDDENLIPGKSDDPKRDKEIGYALDKPDG
ncbi:MAG: hypothetical protein AAFY56_17895, partial [Pseudomonadota bacterium]